MNILNVLGPLSYGGIESLLLDYATIWNYQDGSYDFVTMSEYKSDIECQLVQLGAKVYHITRRRKNIIKHLCELYKILHSKRYYYEIIHVHMSQDSFLPLIIACLCGYKVRIAHAHTSYSTKISYMVKLKVILTTMLASHMVGCSQNACSFLFGSKSSEAVVLRNCINYEKFYFNYKKREKYRKEFSIKNDEIAIVIVGRIGDEKNHTFLCDIFGDSRLENYKLYIIGEGEREKKLKTEIINKGLGKKIIMLGAMGNINDVLNAFDIFVLPSKFEGFPIVLLEAQINGMRCIVSENVTKETKLTDKITYIKLEKERWIKEILSVSRDDILTRTYNGEKTYDVYNCFNELMEFYRNCLADVKTLFKG